MGIGPADSGSSPRARGTAHCLPRFPQINRFIPACAGNSRPGQSTASRAAVHPRVRGEQREDTSHASSKTGSSPRARGTGSPFSSSPNNSRFIPACAGNSFLPSSQTGALPVHPRVRGEQSVCGLRCALHIGSSPRARGTAECALQVVLFVRFIPACAGNSADCPRTAPSLPVHPRVRGEQHTRRINHTASLGSSPRARGTDRLVRPGQAEARFIPACAGNSRRLAWMMGFHSVHPRVRGEQGTGLMSAYQNIGSSPRARGTGLTTTPQATPGRFIPACAGNRTRCTPYRRGIAVHPRVRGEQAGHRPPVHARTGSSPRARGTGGYVLIKGD